MRIIVPIINANLVANPFFIPFLSFRRNQKQELSFQQVDGLITRNIFAFCLQRVALYFKTMPNTDFYKVIFLHIIPVCKIVPCSQVTYQHSNFHYFHIDQHSPAKKN